MERTSSIISTARNKGLIIQNQPFFFMIIREQPHPAAALFVNSIVLRNDRQRLYRKYKELQQRTCIRAVDHNV